MTWVQSALRWPSFVLALAVVLWANTLAALAGRVQFWKLSGPRNDTLGVCKFLVEFFQVRVKRIGRGVLYRGRCMYLANHRSWTDFFLDLYVVEGRAVTLSRLAVLFVFPTTLMSSYALRAIIFFKRGRIPDKEKFNRWLDSRLAKSPYQGFLVYPEGHRSTRGKSLPLKRGMLRYAYDRRLPAQLVITANKDAVLAEKSCTARFGQTVGVTFSDLIDPGRFDSFDAFMGQVQATWDEQWVLADAADLAGLPPLPPAEVDMYYPMGIRLRQAAVVLLWMAVFLLGLVPAMLRCARFVYLTLGAAGPAVVALLSAYTAASFWACSQPVDVRVAADRALRGAKEVAPALAAAPPDAVADKAPEAQAAEPAGLAGDSAGEESG